jgi:hypothetical protein
LKLVCSVWIILNGTETVISPHLGLMPSKMPPTLSALLRLSKTLRAHVVFCLWLVKGKTLSIHLMIYFLVNRVEMRITQTNDGDELANAINNIQINGNADLLTSIKIAQLSLKHRKNKSQRQRIVVFVGHPLIGTEEDFEDVGLRLKKNNVSVDVINFANPENVSRL